MRNGESAWGMAQSSPPDALERLAALSRIAARVQQARTVEGVLASAREGLLELGLCVLVARLSGERLRLQEVGTPRLGPNQRSVFSDLEFPLNSFELVQKAIDARSSMFHEETCRRMLEVMGEQLGQSVDALKLSLGIPPASNGVVSVLWVQDEPWGALWVCSPALSADDCPAFSLFARHLGSALEYARLLENERRRVEELSLLNELGSLMGEHLELSAVLAIGVRHLSRIADVPNTFLMLIDPAGEALRMVASNVEDPKVLDIVIPLDQPSAATQAVEERRPVVIEDPAKDPRTHKGLASRFGHNGLIAVPLVSRGQPIGSMVLGETRPGRRFSSVELERAMAVSHQLAMAISNARLYEEQRRRVEELNLLLDVSRVITASLDLTEILETSARSLARMVEASHAYIWLLSSDACGLRGMATSAREHREHFRTLRLPLPGQSTPALAVTTRMPVRVEDTAHSPLVNRDLNEDFGMKSLLTLPLLVRDEAIGAVVIGDQLQQRAWTEAEVERATVMSRQLAVAVANAQLFEDLKNSYDELAHAQEELVKRERLAALGELAAVVAHEVRNPLGVIFNSLGSLKRMLQPQGDASMLLNMLGEEADRLNRIVSDLLDFARPNPPTLQNEVLEHVINSALETANHAANQSGVQILVEAPLPLPPVPLDARMMRQVLLNLVINAVQAVPRGGKISIRVTDERPQGKDWVRLEVADDGPGIPAESAERLFQPFFTTKASGTGLGLAVVKRFVEAHRGEVGVNSVLGRGTVFTIRLPLESH